MNINDNHAVGARAPRALDRAVELVAVRFRHRSEMQIKGPNVHQLSHFNDFVMIRI